MIRLTRLSGSEFWLNADLIEVMEATPDTVIMLVDGRRIVVKESPEVVAERYTQFRASILRSVGGQLLDESRLTHGAVSVVVDLDGHSRNRAEYDARHPEQLPDGTPARPAGEGPSS